MGIRPIKDYNLYFEYGVWESEGFIGKPNKIDTNWKLREEIARYETYVLLILSLFFLWRKRFKAIEALCKFYNKI